MSALRLTCLLLALFGLPAYALELRTVPAKEVVVYPANTNRGYFDLMLHTIVLHNDLPGSLDLESLQVELLRDGSVIEQRAVDLSTAERTSAEMVQMAEQGMGVFLDLQLLNRTGLSGMLGSDVELAASRSLGENTALLATSQYFAVSSAPDQVRITATGKNSLGKQVTTTTELKAVAHVTLQYGFPLAGNWMMRALPMMQGHHRWIPSSEFARDWFKVGADGASTAGDAAKAENNFGYGDPIVAAADGIVVDVIADQVQDRAALMRQPDETIEVARARISRYNMQRYARDFRKAAAGNLIVLKHEQGGRTEYTSYGHLKAGSVLVKVNDKVLRGQKLAEVGDTGDSSAVHLHFQVNIGPDPFYSASVPFEFDNMRSLFVGQDPGLLVGPQEAASIPAKPAKQ